MGNKESKKAYMCEIDWYHELGETKTDIFPADKKYVEKHHTKSCGIVEVKVTFVRTVKKPKPYPKNPKKTSPAAFTKKQIKSVEKDILEKKKFLSRLKKELKHYTKKKK